MAYRLYLCVVIHEMVMSPVQFVKAVRAQKEPQVQQGCCGEQWILKRFAELVQVQTQMHGTLILS